MQLIELEIILLRNPPKIVWKYTDKFSQSVTAHAPDRHHEVSTIFYV